MIGENKMIVCDKCKQYGTVAGAVRLNLSMWDGKTDAGKTVYSCGSPRTTNPLDLCQKCAGELAIAVRGAVIEFLKS